MIYKDLIDHFAVRASSFSNNGWADNKTILQIIADSASSFCPYANDILDYGAGTGIVSEYLLDKIPNLKSITALDVSSEMLFHITDTRIKCVISSVESTPFNNGQFDLIVSRQCLHYVHDLAKTISESKRILRSNGIFVLTQFVPLEDETKQYWKELTRIRQPLRVNYFSEKDWIDSFTQNGFLPLSLKRFTIQSSVSKWSDHYKNVNESQMQEYTSMLLNAPESYKRKYGIVVKGNDIIGQTHGVTIVFKAN